MFTCILIPRRAQRFRGERCGIGRYVSTSNFTLLIVSTIIVVISRVIFACLEAQERIPTNPNHVQVQQPPM